MMLPTNERSHAEPRVPGYKKDALSAFAGATGYFREIM